MRSVIFFSIVPTNQPTIGLHFDYARFVSTISDLIKVLLSYDSM